MFDAWMEILRRRPDSVLWLLASSPLAVANLRREAQARGIGPDRIVFAPHLPLADHLARLALSDVCLDTAPIGAFTSASDALWAGVPLVTLLWPSPIGRGAASILTALGCEELIAESLEDYIDLALAVADDPARRARLRRHLLAARDGASIFDTPRFTRGLEAALMEMHRRRLQGEPPRPFSIPPVEAPPRPAGDFDPRDPRLVSDPAPMLKNLREQCPVAHAPDFGPGLHMLTRYDDVRTAAYDPSAFSSRQMIAVQTPPSRVFPSPPITWDPPQHRVGRMILTPMFSAMAMEALLPHVEATAAQLIGQIGAAATCDAAVDFTRPFTSRIFARFLGVHDQDGARLQA